MTIARRGLKVNDMGHANAVGLTSIESDFFEISQTLCLYMHIFEILVFEQNGLMT